MTPAELLGAMAAYWSAAIAVLLLARIARSIADDSDRSERPLWSAPLARQRQLRIAYAWAYAELERIVTEVAEPDPTVVIGRPPLQVLAEIRRSVAA